MPRNDVRRSGIRARAPLSTAALAARLQRIKELVEGLARANGSSTPAAQDLADEITRSLDVVRRRLRTDHREQSKGLQSRSPATLDQLASWHEIIRGEPHMAHFEGKTFGRSQIELDGHTFRNCEFRDSVLVYRGGPLPLLAGNTISRCRWHFGDAAGRTLQFLSDLHADGPAGVVDDFVKSIKSRPVDRRRTTH